MGLSTGADPRAEMGSPLTKGAIDSDVHPYLRNGMRDIAPYLSEEWSLHLNAGRPEGGVTAGSFRIPASHYVHLGGTNRLDATTPSGGPPGSDPTFAAEQLLDRHEMGAALLLGGDMFGLGGVANADWAAAIAAAYNDWLADVWLASDSRWKGSVVVAPQDPLKAAQEIARWGDHPSMMSVFIPNSNVLLGKRAMYPIYEAAQHYGFPISIHPGGSGAGINTTMLPVQPASYFVEYLTMQTTVFIAHLCSIIFEGVFDRFPKMKVGLIETGFAWMPHFLWQFDSIWKGLRTETPWVKRPPSEYVREHIRLTSQPMYEPHTKSHLHQIFEMMYADEILMFSSDYPHWNADEPDAALKKVPPELLQKMMHETPRTFYGRDW